MWNKTEHVPFRFQNTLQLWCHWMCTDSMQTFCLFHCTHSFRTHWMCKWQHKQQLTSKYPETLHVKHDLCGLFLLFSGSGADTTVISCCFFGNSNINRIHDLSEWHNLGEWNVNSTCGSTTSISQLRIIRSLYDDAVCKLVWFSSTANLLGNLPNSCSADEELHGHWQSELFQTQVLAPLQMKQQMKRMWMVKVRRNHTLRSTHWQSSKSCASQLLGPLPIATVPNWAPVLHHS